MQFAAAVRAASDASRAAAGSPTGTAATSNSNNNLGRAAAAAVVEADPQRYEPAASSAYDRAQFTSIIVDELENRFVEKEEDPDLVSFRAILSRLREDENKTTLSFASVVRLVLAHKPLVYDPAAPLALPASRMCELMRALLRRPARELRSVHLDEVDFSRPEHAELFATVCEFASSFEPQHVLHLSARRCGLSGKRAASLLVALLSNEHLRKKEGERSRVLYVTLRDNPDMGDAPASSLLELVRSTNLVYLDLGNCGVSSQTAGPILALKEGESSLSSLKLDQNRSLNSSLADYITDEYKHSLYLDLRQCEIGAAFLERALPHMKHRVELSNAEGIEHVVAHLRSSPEFYQTNVHFSDERLVADGKTDHPDLDMSGGFLAACVLRHLNPSGMSNVLFRNDGGLRAFQACCEWLEHHTTVRDVSFFNFRGIHKAEMPAVGQALKRVLVHNKSIRKLMLWLTKPAPSDGNLAGAVRSFGRGFETPRDEKFISQYLGIEAINSIVDGLELNTTLESLSLNPVDITDDGDGSIEDKFLQINELMRALPPQQQQEQQQHPHKLAPRRARSIDELLFFAVLVRRGLLKQELRLSLLPRISQDAAENVFLAERLRDARTHLYHAIAENPNFVHVPLNRAFSTSSVVLVGDSDVGKSALVKRMNVQLNDDVDHLGRTAGTQRLTAELHCGSERLVMNFADTAGSRVFRELSAMQCRVASVVMLVYDANLPAGKCLRSVSRWLSLLHTACDARGTVEDAADAAEYEADEILQDAAWWTPHDADDPTSTDLPVVVIGLHRSSANPVRIPLIDLMHVRHRHRHGQQRGLRVAESLLVDLDDVHSLFSFQLDLHRILSLNKYSWFLESEKLSQTLVFDLDDAEAYAQRTDKQRTVFVYVNLSNSNLARRNVVHVRDGEGGARTTFFFSNDPSLTYDASYIVPHRHEDYIEPADNVQVENDELRIDEDDDDGRLQTLNWARMRSSETDATLGYVPQQLHGRGRGFTTSSTGELLFDVRSGQCEVTPDEKKQGMFFMKTGDSGFATMILRRGVTHGAFFYEVELLTDGLMQLGWASAHHSANSLLGKGVGDDAHSWAYDGFRLVRWHRSKFPFATSAGKWATGDVIGIGVDLDRREMNFFKNGQLLGVAFRGFEPADGLYPALSLSKNQSVRVILDPAEFTIPAPHGYEFLVDDATRGAAAVGPDADDRKAAASPGKLRHSSRRPSRGSARELPPMAAATDAEVERLEQVFEDETRDLRLALEEVVGSMKANTKKKDARARRARVLALLAQAYFRYGHPATTMDRSEARRVFEEMWERYERHDAAYNLARITLEDGDEENADIAEDAKVAESAAARGVELMKRAVEAGYIPALAFEIRRAEDADEREELFARVLQLKAARLDDIRRDLDALFHLSELLLASPQHREEGVILLNEAASRNHPEALMRLVGELPNSSDDYLQEEQLLTRAKHAGHPRAMVELEDLSGKRRIASEVRERLQGASIAGQLNAWMRNPLWLPPLDELQPVRASGDGERVPMLRPSSVMSPEGVGGGRGGARGAARRAARQESVAETGMREARRFLKTNYARIVPSFAATPPPPPTAEIGWSRFFVWARSLAESAWVRGHEALMRRALRNITIEFLSDLNVAEPFSRSILAEIQAAAALSEVELPGGKTFFSKKAFTVLSFLDKPSPCYIDDAATATLARALTRTAGILGSLAFQETGRMPSTMGHAVPNTADLATEHLRDVKNALSNYSARDDHIDAMTCIVQMSEAQDPIAARVARVLVANESHPVRGVVTPLYMWRRAQELVLAQRNPLADSRSLEAGIADEEEFHAYRAVLQHLLRQLPVVQVRTAPAPAPASMSQTMSQSQSPEEVSVRFDDEEKKGPGAQSEAMLQLLSQLRAMRRTIESKWPERYGLLLEDPEFEMRPQEIESEKERKRKHRRRSSASRESQFDVPLFAARVETNISIFKAHVAEEDEDAPTNDLDDNVFFRSSQAADADDEDDVENGGSDDDGGGDATAADDDEDDPRIAARNSGKKVLTPVSLFLAVLLAVLDDYDANDSVVHYCVLSVLGCARVLDAIRNTTTSVTKERIQRVRKAMLLVKDNPLASLFLPLFQSVVASSRVDLIGADYFEGLQALVLGHVGHTMSGDTALKEVADEADVVALPPGTDDQTRAVIVALERKLDRLLARGEDLPPLQQKTEMKNAFSVMTAAGADGADDADEEPALLALDRDADPKKRAKTVGILVGRLTDVIVLTALYRVDPGDRVDLLEQLIRDHRAFLERRVADDDISAALLRGEDVEECLMLGLPFMEEGEGGRGLTMLDWELCLHRIAHVLATALIASYHPSSTASGASMFGLDMAMNPLALLLTQACERVFASRVVRHHIETRFSRPSSAELGGGGAGGLTRQLSRIVSRSGAAPGDNIVATGPVADMSQADRDRHRELMGDALLLFAALSFFRPVVAQGSPDALASDGGKKGGGVGALFSSTAHRLALIRRAQHKLSVLRHKTGRHHSGGGSLPFSESLESPTGPASWVQLGARGKNRALAAALAPLGSLLRQDAFKSLFYHLIADEAHAPLSVPLLRLVGDVRRVLVSTASAELPALATLSFPGFVSRHPGSFDTRRMEDTISVLHQALRIDEEVEQHLCAGYTIIARKKEWRPFRSQVMKSRVALLSYGLFMLPQDMEGDSEEDAKSPNNPRNGGLGLSTFDVQQVFDDDPAATRLKIAVDALARSARDTTSRMEVEAYLDPSEMDETIERALRAEAELWELVTVLKESEYESRALRAMEEVVEAAKAVPRKNDSGKWYTHFFSLIALQLVAMGAYAVLLMFSLAEDHFSKDGVLEAFLAYTALGLTYGAYNLLSQYRRASRILTKTNDFNRRVKYVYKFVFDDNGDGELSGGLGGSVSAVSGRARSHTGGGTSNPLKKISPAV